jgi:hypothetical protein
LKFVTKRQIWLKKPAGSPKTAPAIAGPSKGVVVASKQAFKIQDGSKDRSDPKDPKGYLWTITNMPPDIAEYAIDKPVNTDVKVGQALLGNIISNPNSCI